MLPNDDDEFLDMFFQPRDRIYPWLEYHIIDTNSIWDAYNAIEDMTITMEFHLKNQTGLRDIIV